MQCLLPFPTPTLHVASCWQGLRFLGGCLDSFKGSCQGASLDPSGTHNRRAGKLTCMYTRSTTALELGEHNSHASLGLDAMGVRSFCRTGSLIRQRADQAGRMQSRGWRGSPSIRRSALPPRALCVWQSSSARRVVLTTGRLRACLLLSAGAAGLHSREHRA